jgi:hypothetical protein
MATTIVTKQHDDKITFRDTPTIDNVVVPPGDLVGCTVKFIMKLQGSTIPEVLQTAVINGDGTFSYNPVPADVANIGKFQQEWEVTYPSGKQLTFPNGGYNIVKIIYSLNPAT